MRRVCYSVAVSLDGYLAGPNGEVDWIPMDPDVDFGELFAGFDTIVMGRGTYEAARAMGGASIPGMRAFVVSRTLKQEDWPDVTVADNPQALVAALKAESGKDIWLMGGGTLFRSLLRSGLVDAVEVTVCPVLLGGGVLFAPPSDSRATLSLVSHRLYAKSGLLLLRYAVVRDSDRSGDHP